MPDLEVAPVRLQHGARPEEPVVEVQVEVLRLHSLRSLTARAAGHGPGPEASIDKLLMTAAEQTLLDTAVTALGARGVNDPSWFDQYLYSRAASIYGGTSEIQKGIIAQRLLGMPR